VRNTSRREVDLVLRDEAVDEVVDQLGHRLLEQRHLLGGEDRVEDLAVLLVLRRVDLQRDERADVAEVDGRHVRREDLGVTKRLLDLGPPGQQHADAVDGHDGRGLAQRLEHRLRVGRHLRIHRRERAAGRSLRRLVAVDLGSGAGFSIHGFPSPCSSDSLTRTSSGPPI
jgi:hypothetical protein